MNTNALISLLDLDGVFCGDGFCDTEELNSSMAHSLSHLWTRVLKNRNEYIKHSYSLSAILYCFNGTVVSSPQGY